MKRLVLPLLFAACAFNPLQPDYVEVGGGYGDGDFNLFGLEAEHWEVRINFGYVLRPMVSPPRLRYTGEYEEDPRVDLPHARPPVEALGGGLRPGDEGVPAVREGEHSHPPGSTETETPPGPGTPWWASTGFLASLVAIIAALGSLFHPKVREHTVHKVFKKSPPRRG